MMEVSSEQARSQLYTHRAAGAAALLLCVVITVFFLFLLRRHRVRFHNIVPGSDRL